MSEKLPLSVVMIARNEAGLIARAIKSAQFAEEILVVDAFSSDETTVIAEKHGARVIKRGWTNFSDQRNYSLSQAKYPWVLVLDADEAISDHLVQWLKDFFASGKQDEAPYGYQIKRAEFFLGKRIYGACWNPSYQDRFLFKNKVHYIGTIHEYPVVEGGMVLAPPEALIEHNPNITVESFFEKMNRYTTIEAHDKFREGKRTSISHLSVVFFATWWKNFFYYKGYRDGVYGFVICLMEAVSRTVRHIKLWQIQEMHKKGQSSFLPDSEKALEIGASSHRKYESTEGLF